MGTEKQHTFGLLITETKYLVTIYVIKEVAWFVNIFMLSEAEEKSLSVVVNTDTNRTVSFLKILYLIFALSILI